MYKKSPTKLKSKKQKKIKENNNEIGNIYQKNIDQLINYKSEYSNWSPIPMYFK